MTDIADWPRQAKALIIEADDDTDLVDIAGDLNSVIAQLGVLKRDVASEVPSDTRGTRWRYFIPGMKAKRTYNMSSLFMKFMTHWDDKDTWETFKALINHGIIKVEWQYSKLDAYAKKNNINLKRTSNEEVYDGDDFDIGEIWHPQYPKYEPIIDE
jgi:hypothetical protein